MFDPDISCLSSCAFKKGSLLFADHCPVTIDKSSQRQSNNGCTLQSASQGMNDSWTSIVLSGTTTNDSFGLFVISVDSLSQSGHFSNYFPRSLQTFLQYSLDLDASAMVYIKNVFKQLNFKECICQNNSKTTFYTLKKPEIQPLRTNNQGFFSSLNWPNLADSVIESPFQSEEEEKFP